MYKPDSIEALQQIVFTVPHLLPTGGHTKSALSSPITGFEQVSLGGLSGILSYEPEEFTISALAGTPLTEIQRHLENHGQCMPFDPPFVRQGSTMGGLVASGLNGPGRVRSGGVRDFILSATYMDGLGRLVHGGGNVVKNAAGFDLPKLMTGSLGSLGILIKLTFKVFPQPEAFTTIKMEFHSWESAIQALGLISATSLDMLALDLVPSAQEIIMWIRLYGLASVMPAKTERICQLIGGGEMLDQSNDKKVWQEAREFEWVPSSWSLFKIPITPSKIISWEKAIAQTFATEMSLRHYSGTGQVCWLATQIEIEQVAALLAAHDMAGLHVLGKAGSVLLGNYPGRSFYRRVKSAMDPNKHFREL